MIETSQSELPRTSSLDSIDELKERCQNLWGKIREILDTEREILIPAMIQHQIRIAIISAQHDAAQRQLELDHQAARQAAKGLIQEILRDGGRS